MANPGTAARNRKQFERLVILHDRTYKQVCESVKRGILSTNVVVKVPRGYYRLFTCEEVGRRVAYNDLDVRNGQSLTILHVCIGLDDQAMVDELLARKVDLKATTRDVLAPLQFAVKGYKMTSVKKLLVAGANVNHYGPDRLSPLIVAMNNPRLDMVELLIRHGAEIDVTNCRGAMSQLCLAASKNFRPKFLELLIKRGADPNLVVTEPTEGWITTPLMSACHAKAPRAVEFLINLPNIDISRVNNKNETCLFLNVNGPTSRTLTRDPAQASCLSLILSTNIDVNTRNNDKNLPLHYDPDRSEKYVERNGIIKSHLIKLMAAGFYICEEYRDILDKDAETDRIQAECSKEVQLMMNTYESSINWSLFKILRASQHQLTLRYKHIQGPAGKQKELIEKFPIYGRILAFHLKKALQRKVLFKKAEEVLFDIFYKFLPAPFINNLFYYLSNFDLYQLIE